MFFTDTSSVFREFPSSSTINIEKKTLLKLDQTNGILSALHAKSGPGDSCSLILDVVEIKDLSEGTHFITCQWESETNLTHPSMCQYLINSNTSISSETVASPQNTSTISSIWNYITSFFSTSSDNSSSITIVTSFPSIDSVSTVANNSLTFAANNSTVTFDVAAASNASCTLM